MQSAMADGVDALVDPVQAPAGDSLANRTVAQAEVAMLSAATTPYWLSASAAIARSMGSGPGFCRYFRVS